MPKKSRFWGGFWGETGRNSGKWLSNKIFGPTGWATPKRLIFDNDTGNSESNSSNENRSDADAEWDELRINNLLEVAHEISFNDSNVESICSSLDNLLTAARKANKYAQSNKLSSDIFQTKINAGIMRLRRLSEKELADFYQLELQKLKRSTLLKKATPFVLILVLLIFVLGLGKYIESLPKQPNPIEDFFKRK
jgi:hypothetical protein